MTHHITANIGYDRCGRARRRRESPPWGELATSLSGFSVVACLISNALALSMLSALFAASAELVAAGHLAAERMDQGIRLRQVNRYLDSVLSMAQMPRKWRQPKAASSAPPRWRAPSDPCSLPESSGGRGEWGGVNIIRLDDAPCLPGKAQGLGLYIETIYPCPDACERGAGYALAPEDCILSMTDGGAITARWRAQWQQSLTSLEGCPPGTPWARLERLVLSHRSTGPSGGSDQLRAQRLAGKTGTRWTPGEVLVGDVVAWRLVMLSVYPHHDETVLVAGPQLEAADVTPAAVQYPQLSFSVAPSAKSSQPEMTAVRLLVPWQ